MTAVSQAAMKREVFHGLNKLRMKCFLTIKSRVRIVFVTAVSQTAIGDKLFSLGFFVSSS
jgi:hypothetical protein